MCRINKTVFNERKCYVRTEKIRDRCVCVCVFVFADFPAGFRLSRCIIRRMMINFPMKICALIAGGSFYCLFMLKIFILL